MCGIIGIISKNFEQNSNWIKDNLSKILHRDQTVMDFGIQKINLCLWTYKTFDNRFICK